MKKILFIFLILFCFNQVDAQEKKLAGQIAILAYHGVPADETSLSRYQEMKETGVTHSLTFFFKNADAVENALKIAQKTGIKMIITCPELKTDPKKTVKRFMNNPALAGYFLFDEPNTSSFPALTKWVNEIHSVDPKHYCYLNLLPNYASPGQLGAKNYREYVHRFVSEVPMQLLSFDHYPITSDSEVRANWYENLEIVSDEARKANIPFWAFALTVAHGPYHVPTIAELRLEVYSDLAYGAQGIQYFTYWIKETDWNYHHGPITREGKRTDVYDKIKFINKEIKDLSFVFLNSRVVSVAHTGDNIPYGTSRLTELPASIKSLETKGSGAVVSLLEKGKSYFFVIVNRDFNKSMELMIKTDPTVKRVLKDGSLVAADSYDNILNVEPGDAVIYTFPRK